LIYAPKPLLLQEKVQDAKSQFVAKLSHKVFDRGEECPDLHRSPHEYGDVNEPNAKTSRWKVPRLLLQFAAGTTNLPPA
jgi:hypothetical protein